MNEQSAYVYYTTQAANRRHFQTLFFAVVGFTWGFALSVFVVLEPRVGTPALLASGLVLVGGAFISQRLLRRERASFEEMSAAWRTIAQLRGAPKAGRAFPGAMAIACASQAVIGLGLLVSTLLR